MKKDSLQLWTWDKKGLSAFHEQIAWNLFREIHLGIKKRSDKVICIYCGGRVQRTSRRKEGNQIFYQCINCKKRFNDLTKTLFHKSRLSMKTIMFLIVLSMDNIPKNRIYQLLNIAKTTVHRYFEIIKSSQLCQELYDVLLQKRIVKDRIIEYLKPTCQKKMKYYKQEK